VSATGPRVYSDDTNLYSPVAFAVVGTAKYSGAHLNFHFAGLNSRAYAVAIRVPSLLLRCTALYTFGSRFRDTRRGERERTSERARERERERERGRGRGRRIGRKEREKKRGRHLEMEIHRWRSTRISSEAYLRIRLLIAPRINNRPKDTRGVLQTPVFLRRFAQNPRESVHAYACERQETCLLNN